MSVAGVQSVVVNIGGDIVVAGEQKENILITDPFADAENDKPMAVLSLQDRAIATSGNYRKGFQIGNKWFSHILDVRTAMPASEIISATVIAKNATDAGALATAFNILSPKESSSLAATVPDIDYQIVTKTGEKIVSDGWKGLVLEVKIPAANKKRRPTMESQLEVSIDFELARFEGRFHRPFVAVWIEDKKKESVHFFFFFLMS